MVVISHLPAEFPAHAGVNPALREGGKPGCISCSEESQQTQRMNALKHRDNINSIHSKRGFFSDRAPECSFCGTSAAMFTTIKEVKGIKRIFSPYRAVFYSKIAGSLWICTDH